MKGTGGDRSGPPKKAQPVPVLTSTLSSFRDVEASAQAIKKGPHIG